MNNTSITDQDFDVSDKELADLEKKYRHCYGKQKMVRGVTRAYCGKLWTGKKIRTLINPPKNACPICAALSQLL